MVSFLLSFGLSSSSTWAQQLSVEEAVAEALANEEIQSYFPENKPPEQVEPPGWLLSVLEAIGSVFQGIAEFLGFLGPVLKIVFYLGLAAIIAWFIYFLVDKFDWSRRGQSDKNKVAVKRTIISNMPAKPVKRMVFSLGDADALASNGNYSDAVHILLIAAIDVIQRKIKGFLAISETSREIVDNVQVSTDDRSLISHIVRQVESALFAGHVVKKEDYEFCRVKFLELKGENVEGRK